MRCPTLNELPPPATHQTGWLWTEESPQLDEVMADGSPWLRISIVTPSYNQAQFIEETIRSVLLQGYPNLEYIVIDGGSTDNSVEIIQKYERWLTYWVSEPDQGQTHAINKGFARATGHLISWLNSDDLLLPRALAQFAVAARRFPHTILLGDAIHIHEFYGFSRPMKQKNVTFQRMIQPWRYQNNTFWSQPGTYVPAELNHRVGKLDESLHYVFDQEWLCRLLRIAPVHYMHVPVVKFRLHGDSKTVAKITEWFQEEGVVIDRYAAQADVDQRLAQAALEVRCALVYLRMHTWHRSHGLNHLKRAWQRDWRVLLLPEFGLAALKAVTPFTLLKMARNLYHRKLRSSTPDV